MIVKGYDIEEMTVSTAVVGSGAAGYNAACMLRKLGVSDVLLVTENRLGGTSRNTGSDKQTYYKLTLSGDTPDSVYEMAQTLFEGLAVDGDIALCEAALSAKSFLHLADLGLGFPTNRYGEYVGYKTDHDPRNRATSIGPYTSREMTRALENEARNLKVPVRNGLQVVRLLVKDGECKGLLCINTHAKDPKSDLFVLIHSNNVVYATGGPAGMYSESVYPQSQHGASGIAFEAGVRGRNLTEWQFGLASVKPRWNVSGTYMQALPRMVSTRKDGSDEREFLCDFFTEAGEMLSKLFLKGYQWPFDVRKVDGGSSIIDILVYLETCKGRRVFLDFTRDPLDGNFDFTCLSAEAYSYLDKGHALVRKPIERLRIMNQPAIDFYRDKGVDLESQKLEIALCAQHNNGGLDINCWWESNIRGFFPVGEVAGSHGVYRPGGSALNAGQVGSTRAATYIARCRSSMGSETAPEESAKDIESAIELLESAHGEHDSIRAFTRSATERMSSYGGAIRNLSDMETALVSINDLLNDPKAFTWSKPCSIKDLFKLHDALVCQKCYLSAMIDYAKHNLPSRGSALYYDQNGSKPYSVLPDKFTYRTATGKEENLIQEMSYDSKAGTCSFNWRPVRPVPENDDFFENTWRHYRENGNVY